jgi:hypothetical protein
MDLPWTWHNPDDDRRRLPDEALPEPEADRDWIGRQLAGACSEAAATLVLYGWSAAALDWLEREPALLRRAVVWAVRPGHLRTMLAHEPRLRALLPGLLVAPVDGIEDLPTFVSRLPYVACSVAVLTGVQADVDAIVEARRWRLTAWYFTPERLLADVAHFLHIEPTIGDAIAITSWREAWRGRSALCIAAGPSLDRRIDFIREHMHRCLVVAADVVAGRLMDMGIKVDFVVNADSHDAAVKRIPTPTDPATVLICPFEGHRDLPARCPRRSYEGFGPIGGNYVDERHSYNHGSNVGSCTVGFAAYAGCREFILIGHDLSFSREAYYSRHIAGRDEVERFSQESARAAKRTAVLGNDGRMLETTFQFQHGVNDLATISHRLAMVGGVVYNPNIADGIGARIAHTSALPDGWRPAGAGDSPRPGAGVRLAEQWAGRPPPPFRAEARRQMAAYRERVRALPADPSAFVGAAEELFLDRGLHLGHGLLAGFWVGRLLLMYRHLLVGARGQSTAAVAAALRRDIDACLDAGQRVVEAVLDTAQPPAERAPADACGPAAEALRQRVPRPETGGVDDALLGNILRDEYRARNLAPDLPLPEPASAWDGIHIIAALGRTCPQALWQRVLALAGLSDEAGLAYVLDHARAHGAPPADLAQPQSDAGLRAAAALLALRRDPADAAVARAAAAWPPLHQPLVEALLAAGRRGLPALEAVVGDGLVALDDALAGAIVARCCDPLRGIALVAPHEARLGERTALAVAERHLALGDAGAALATADRIGLLCPAGEAAAVLRCRCRWRLEGADGVSAEINAIPGQELAVRVLWAFTLVEEGVAQAIDQLVRLGVEPVPVAVLSQGFERIGRDAPPALMPALFEALLHLARRSRAVTTDPTACALLDEMVALGDRARRLSAGG